MTDKIVLSYVVNFLAMLRSAIIVPSPNICLAEIFS